MSSTHHADIVITPAQGAIFNNTQLGDLAIFTESSNQNIHIAPTVGGHSILSVSKCNVTAGGHILPLSNEAYDLGSSNMRFRDLFLSGQTIYLGGTKLSTDPATSTFELRDSEDNTMAVFKKAVNPQTAKHYVFDPDVGSIQLYDTQTEQTTVVSVVNGGSGITAARTFKVSNAGFAFTIEGLVGNNPQIALLNGHTYAFELTIESTHPFIIRESSGGPAVATGMTHVATDGTTTEGAAANVGHVTGTLYWTIGYTTSSFVYQCVNHGSMIGNIFINDVRSQGGSIPGLSNTPGAVFVVPGSNLGVGTSTPQAQLHVAGDTLIEGDIQLGANRNLNLTRLKVYRSAAGPSQPANITSVVTSIPGLAPSGATSYDFTLSNVLQTQYRFLGSDFGVRASITASGAMRAAPASATASEPAFSFLNDASTGVYNPTPGVVGFSALGDHVAQVSSSGITVRRRLRVTAA